MHNQMINLQVAASPGIIIAYPGQDVELPCALPINLSNGTETAWLVNNMGLFGTDALFNGTYWTHCKCEKW